MPGQDAAGGGPQEGQGRLPGRRPPGQQGRKGWSALSYEISKIALYDIKIVYEITLVFVQ